MTSSLIPERPLLISPTLAATIGLEEAVMLHVISELLLQHQSIYRNQRRWVEMTQAALQEALPFWTPDKITNVQASLQEKGLIQIENIGNNGQTHLYAINQIHKPKQNNTAHQTMAVHEPSKQETSSYKVFNQDNQNTNRKLPIPANWQPNETLYQLCQQRNIPREFVEQRVKGFVMYWRERGDTQFSWHNAFLKRMVVEWEQEQSYKGAKEFESNMSSKWRPSGDALSILEHAGVNASFIEDAIPEFVLFWRERGLITSTWNTKFIAHIRRQWGKFTLTLEHDNTPRLIPEEYQPSTACFEVLAMANIDLDFARNQVKEFILYWQERKEPYPSWNTKFLQHVKFRWANQHQSNQPLLEKITDRSWAE